MRKKKDAIQRPVERVVKCKVLYIWSCFDCPYGCWGENNKDYYCRNVTTYPRRIRTVKGQIVVPKWCGLEDNPKST